MAIGKTGAYYSKKILTVNSQTLPGSGLFKHISTAFLKLA